MIFTVALLMGFLVPLTIWIVEIRALLIILEEGDSMGLPVISVTSVVLRGLEETGFSDAGKSY